MAKVFLDTNYVIDAIHRKPETVVVNQLIDHQPYASPLSFHIYCYTFKIKLPNKTVSGQTKKFSLVDLTPNILDKALTGPTDDLEDNIQLHSCAAADCDFFLTNDQLLLNLKFFGKTQLVSHLS